jgi:predicted TIM-barrel fold metal-dependent hydrolase
VNTPLTIVDAHQHFWDPGSHYYPWLCDEPMIKFRYGDYSAIRRPYLPADYLSDAASFRIRKTVYLECGWNPGDPVGEMVYVQTLRRATGLPTVAVAHAALDRPDVESVLEQHAGFDFVRGIRCTPRANPTPQDGAPGGTADARWRAGFALLARHGLRFDLLVPWWHLREAARLAADYPGTQMILNHTGLPADRSAAGLAAWESAMANLAACPNVAVKISGLGTPGAPWTVAANREIVLRIIDLFGVERAMFASNFPIDSLCASFATIFEGFSSIVAGFSVTERQSLFQATAERIYAIEQQ